MTKEEQTLWGNVYAAVMGKSNYHGTWDALRAHATSEANQAVSKLRRTVEASEQETRMRMGGDWV